MMPVALAALALYLAIIAAVSIYSLRYTNTRDPVDYFITRSGLSGFVSAMTYAATTYSAFMMIGLVGLSYDVGVGAFAFEMAYLVFTVALLTVVGIRVWELAKERGYVTPTQLLRDRLGSSAAAAATALYTAAALISYSAVQLVGPATLLSTVSGGSIDYSTALMISTAAILLTSFTAGFRSVAWTDAVQGMLMLGASLAMLTWVLSIAPPGWVGKLAEMGRLSPFNERWTPTKFFSYTLPWIFFALTNPQVFQRLYVPKDRKAYLRMVALFTAFGLMYTVITVSIGLAARGAVELGAVRIDIGGDLNKVTPSLLLLAHPVLAILVAVSIIAAATSTVNSIILTISSMISYDVGVPEKYRALVGRSLIPVFTLVLLVFSYYRPGFVVTMAVTSSALLLPLVQIYLGAVYGFGGRAAFITSAAVGFTVAPLAITLWPANLFGSVPREVIILAISSLAYVAGATIDKLRSDINKPVSCQQPTN